MRWLTHPGRYRALKKLDSKIALETFEKYKDFYHPICRGMVEKDLGRKEKSLN
jgi:leukotriene-A4 hydrolase